MICNQTILSPSEQGMRGQEFPPRWRSRVAWGGAAIALLAGTVLQVQDHGGGWLALGFAFMPDLGLLAGMQRDLPKGQLAPRAVPLYNVLHRLPGPLALGALALSGILPQVWLGAALAWSLHIAIDRAVGYGLRGADGFQRSR